MRVRRLAPHFLGLCLCTVAAAVLCPTPASAQYRGRISITQLRDDVLKLKSESQKLRKHDRSLETQVRQIGQRAEATEKQLQDRVAALETQLERSQSQVRRLSGMLTLVVVMSLLAMAAALFAARRGSAGSPLETVRERSGYLQERLRAVEARVREIDSVS